MKRDGIDHPKVHILASILGWPRYQVVGLLEMLWAYTAKWHPDGGIPETKRAEFELWSGVRTDAHIWDALLQAGLLHQEQTSQRGALNLVHDWHEHCDDAVHLKLARAGRKFASGHDPSTKRLSVKAREEIKRAQKSANVRTNSAPPEPEPVHSTCTSGYSVPLPESVPRKTLMLIEDERVEDSGMGQEGAKVGGRSDDLPQVGTDVAPENDRPGKRPSRSKSRQSTPSRSERDRFDRFWTAYPRKIGKLKCAKWWDTHKPDEELTCRMVSAIGVWKCSPDWQKEGGTFIPHPITWLHRGGWEDEAPGPAPSPYAPQQPGRAPLPPPVRKMPTDEEREAAQVKLRGIVDSIKGVA